MKFKNFVTSIKNYQLWLVKKKNNICQLLGFIAVVSLGLGVWFELHQPNIFPVTTIKIVGLWQHVDKAQLKTIITPYTKIGFFNVDINKLREQLETMPWINTADVKRVWPHTLEIYITEKKPVVIFNKTSLMTAAGQRFQPDIRTIPNNLPEIIAPETSSKDVFLQYQQLAKLLSALPMKVRRLEISDRFAVKLIFSNQFKVNLGNEQVVERLQKFIEVYPKMVQNQENKIQYVDMRYPNGMVISWKSR